MSKSSPSGVPTSTWSFTSKANLAGVPQRRIFHVARFVAAHRHRFVRQVGHSDQHGLQFGLNLLQAGGGLFQLDLDAATWALAASAPSLSPLPISMPICLTAGCAGLAAPRCGFAASCARIPGPGTLPRSGRPGAFAGFQTRDRGVEVFAEKKNVKHGVILEGTTTGLLSPGWPGSKLAPHSTRPRSAAGAVGTPVCRGCQAQRCGRFHRQFQLAPQP